MCTVYNTSGYLELVSKATEQSMQAAVEEVQRAQDYATKGEVSTINTDTQINKIAIYTQWVITDARHDSTANAYHTTVPCLSGRYVYYSIIIINY